MINTVGQTLKLQLSEWIKLAIVLSAPIIFTLRTDWRATDNSKLIEANAKAVKQLTESIEAIVRNDERIQELRRRVDVLEEMLRKGAGAENRPGAGPRR